MAKAHIGTVLDEALNSQKLQGKVPSDFLAVDGKAVDSGKLNGLLSSQFLRSDTDNTLAGKLTINSLSSHLILAESGVAKWYVESVSGELKFVDATGERLRLNATKALFNSFEMLHSGNTSSYIASASKEGFMSISDKNKLDAIEARAISETSADLRYLRFNGGNQTIIGGKLTLDNPNHNTHLQIKRTVNAIDYGADITPSTTGMLDFLPLSGTVGFKFTGKINATGDIVSDTNTFSGINIVTLNTNFNNHNGSGGSAHALVTTSVHGFMSSTDKSKLDAIQSSAINQTTADGRYLQLTGGVVSGLLTSTGGVTINKSSAHLTFQESGVSKWHVESVSGVLKFVETGVQTRLSLESTKATYNGSEIFHVGNVASYLATTSANGFMSSADKTKLNGIASGAEVNQNAFSNIAVAGNATVSANSKTATLTFVAGDGINITTDSTGLKVTLQASVATDFVSVSGDTMSGSLAFANNVGINGTNTLGEVANLAMVDTGNISVFGTTVRKTRIHSNVNPTVKVGVNEYEIYHTGNFNSASVFNKTGDTMTGQLVIEEAHAIKGVADSTDNVFYSFYKADSTTRKGFIGFGSTTTNMYQIHNDAGDIRLSTASGNINMANHTGFASTSSFTGLATFNGGIRGGATGGAVVVDSGNGTITIGALNTSYAHFNTDRASFYFYKSLNVATGVFSSSGTDLQLQSSGTTRITIKDANGYVGIGTTAPSYQLDVNGAIKSNGSFQTTSASFDFLNVGSAVSIRTGGITVSNNYADSSKKPTDGIYSKGDVYTDSSFNVSNKVKIQFNATENSLDFVFI